MTQRKLSELFGSRRNPFLVAGGGPSAPAGLETALVGLGMLTSRAEFTVISANHHGFRLPGCPQPDFIVAKDDVHSVTKQRVEEWLRPHCVPIISPHPWADIHIDGLYSNWACSGLIALGVAAVLGATEIWAVGFDMYQGSDAYFDRPGHTKSRYRQEGDARIRSDLRWLWRDIAGVPVHAASGPLSDPKWSQQVRTETRLEREYRLAQSETRLERDKRRMSEQTLVYVR